MIASFCVGRLDDHTVGISARSLGDVNVQVVMEQLNALSLIVKENLQKEIKENYRFIFTL